MRPLSKGLSTSNLKLGTFDCKDIIQISYSVSYLRNLLKSMQPSIERETGTLVMPGMRHTRIEHRTPTLKWSLYCLLGFSGEDVFVILHKVCANSRSCEVPYGSSQNMLVLQLFVLWTCIAFVLGFSRCVGNGCAGGIVPPGVAANLTCCEQQKACVCMKFMTIRYVGLPCSGQPSERWLFENTFDSPCSLIWT